MEHLATEDDRRHNKDFWAFHDAMAFFETVVAVALTNMASGSIKAYQATAPMIFMSAAGSRRFTRL